MRSAQEYSSLKQLAPTQAPDTLISSPQMMPKECKAPYADKHPTHLTMAQGLLSQRQETRRTTYLNLLAGVCNSGHCGVCHATFQYTKQKTEHLWRQTRITNSGSLRKTKGMVQRQRLRGYRETGPHCSCLCTETSITCTTASANQMHTTCTHI